jgi:CheY-like chemotaxis protein
LLPYEQGGSRSFGNTGLGLAIAKSLVSLMAGHMDASSQPGAGSRFSVEIPFKLHSPQAMLVDAQAQPNALVADDSDESVLLGKLLFERLGYAVHACNTAEAAVARAGQQPYDAMLIDVDMPQMGGVAAIRTITALRASGSLSAPCVLAFSAHIGEETREACLAAGADGFIPKPLTVAGLRDAIEKVANARSAKDAKSTDEKPIAVPEDLSALL